jgi:cob(I)alamin adenosyltransferase
VGLLIIYTGNGKGKTSAAMGTAFRAVGQGLKVLMVQFIKGSWHYGELDTARMIPEDRFQIVPMGRGFVKVGAEKPDPRDVEMVLRAWEFGRERLLGGHCDLLVLDEINYAIHYGMLGAEEVAETLARRPEPVHVILTGRNAHPKLVEMADLVTEMKEIKHPFQKGIQAMRGIDY